MALNLLIFARTLWLSPPQKPLLDWGLSESGAKTAADIRRLDPQEDRGGGVRLGPDRYAITIFGQPSSNARWGWRVEGHHLTLNWTIEAGRVVR